VSGAKSSDPLSLDFVPSILDHVKSPSKKKEPEMSWTNLEEDQKQKGGGCHMVRDKKQLKAY